MTEVTIATQGLTKRFGEVVALAGIDIEVPAGIVFGLLGPNGAGKTTAIRILTTILQPDGGTAQVIGYDVTRQPQAVREVIGLAGQYAAVDENLTGRENLRLIGRLTHLPTRDIGPRADELLERFGLTDAANRPVKTYSGGMRRRLDLSAALVHRPPVLFLDEPTTGLDITSRRDLWEVIGELTDEGTTVLLTTQYLEEADQLAETLAVIDRGLVIAEGTPAHLKEQSGTTVIDVRLGGPEQAAQAAQLLVAAGHAEPIILGDTVELSAQDGAGDLVGVLRTLDGAGVVPAGVAVREPSLDDVFLALTGHRAEPRNGEADAAPGPGTDGTGNADGTDGAVPSTNDPSPQEQR